MKRSLIALPVIVASIAIAACGDDDDGSGESDSTGFLADADAVCVETARELADLALAREAPPSDEQTTVAAIQENVPVLEQALTDLEALEPPPDVSADYDEFLAARRQGIDVRQEAVDASEQRDSKGFEAAAAEIGPAIEQAEQVGEQIGFEACGNVLPEDDVAAVEAAEEEASAVDDPAVFCEFFLPQGLQQFYGTDDPQKCIDDPKSAESVQVEVQEVSGVDHVTAFAVVEFPELKGGGRGPFEDTLYYVDGEWRLYSSATP
jgi:hypothetical protein